MFCRLLNYQGKNLQRHLSQFLFSLASRCFPLELGPENMDVMRQMCGMSSALSPAPGTPSVVVLWCSLWLLKLCRLCLHQSNWFKLSKMQLHGIYIQYPSASFSFSGSGFQVFLYAVFGTAFRAFEGVVPGSDRHVFGISLLQGCMVVPGSLW